MLGRICDSYEEGLKVKEIIDKKKIVKHSENIFHIDGYSQFLFVYINKDAKNEHEKQMINEGWKVVKGQSIIYVYNSFHDDRKIFVPCGIYQKRIKGSLEE